MLYALIYLVILKSYHILIAFQRLGQIMIWIVIWRIQLPLLRMQIFIWKPRMFMNRRECRWVCNRLMLTLSFPHRFNYYWVRDRKIVWFLDVRWCIKHLIELNIVPWQILWNSLIICPLLCLHLIVRSSRSMGHGTVENWGNFNFRFLLSVLVKGHMNLLCLFSSRILF